MSQEQETSQKILERWRLEGEFRVNASLIFSAAVAAINHARDLAPEAWAARSPWAEEPAEEIVDDIPGGTPARFPEESEERRARGYIVRLAMVEERVQGQRISFNPVSVELQEMDEPFEIPEAWGGVGDNLELLKSETAAIWERKSLAEASAGPAARGPRRRFGI